MTHTEIDWKGKIAKAEWTMFDKTAEYYGLIYTSFKDYEHEASQVADLIRTRRPEAKEVVEVACGPALHSRYLEANHGFSVDGVDLDEQFISIAREENPGGRFELGNMRSFDMGKTYDAVICLFSSIGYMKTKEELAAAIGNMKRHAAPGGVIIVEPWLQPDAFVPGRLHLHTVEKDGISIARMTVGELDGRISRFRMHYLIGVSGSIRHEKEIHELALFSREEMEEAFEKSGLIPEIDPVGFTDRGLYIAVNET
ncbi:MAG: class I SAM-dependent methyltransferase [Aridibacter famidurans]|nr:class I SAM-dependent methyltransferase [Aridibacter famidurans]